MIPARTIRICAAVASAGLVAWSSQLPLWQMTMRAPQYPKGLRLYAFGTRMHGDLSELNILNHYIGMPAVEAPAFETSMFPIGIGLLVVLCLASPAHAWLRRAAVTTAALMPIGILADLQWRLYEFGHTLNPTAPIRLKPFTPLVIGQTQMGNFVSSAMISWGVVCLVGAALLLWSAGRFGARHGAGQRLPRARRTAALAAMVLLATVPPAARASAPTSGPSSLNRDQIAERGARMARRDDRAYREYVRQEQRRQAGRPAREVVLDQRGRATSLLQARIDATPPGGTVVVPAGIHSGAITIRGPLSVIAERGAIIDGGGTGSVVTISGDDVVFRGFTVRNSGREVTQEAAGITVTGNRHRIESNDVHDVYFGIHIGAGRDAIVQDNTIAPGLTHGARPGHGISVWNMDDTQILRNRISHARDGIYLSFTNRIAVVGNAVTQSRYGLHSMYSQDARFEDNDAAGNLLGAALMMSDRLVLRRNRIREHREGPAAYGLLLKDIGDLVAEDNDILANRVGVYAEGVPASPAKEAIFRGNVIAGNEVGLALQSTAALTMTANRIAENLTDVRPLGRLLSSGMRWTRDGRGNSWGQYRGFDADRDGIGDVPHALQDAMDGLVRRNSLIQAFLYTPAHLALESAARMFPLYRQAHVLVDERPLMTMPKRGPR